MGFASGMVLSGVFISKLSWRWAFFCSAGVNLGVLAGAWWGLPRVRNVEPVRLATFWGKVDWIGAALVSSSLGMFFYVLAYFPHPPPSPRSFHCDGGCMWMAMLMVGLWRMGSAGL